MLTEWVGMSRIARAEMLKLKDQEFVPEGVTSFLATTITQSVEVLTNAVTNVANVMESGYDGAEILGIHFEGPYLDMRPSSPPYCLRRR